MAPHNAYQVAGDDAWISIAVASDGQPTALCDVLARSELAEDERFAGAEARKRHEDALDELLREALRTCERHELECELQERGAMELRVALARRAQPRAAQRAARMSAEEIAGLEAEGLVGTAPAGLA